MYDLAKFRGPAGSAFGRRTIDVLQERSVPTAPANYEVWASHLLGDRPDLSREIEARIAAQEPFTDAFNASIHERFFANTRLTFEMVEAGEGIARELAEVVTSLRCAGDQTGTYVNTLNDAAAQLDGRFEPAAIRAMMAKLAAATRETAERNVDLMRQMEASSRQVESLKATLHNVKVEALSDSLTGLANRKCFDETLRKCMREANEHGKAFCLLLCDIDHFKRFNDTWGHLIGDQVLRFVATVLKQHVTGDHLAARYGGEEFAIVMPRTTHAAALSLGDILRIGIRSKRLTRRSTGDEIGAVTASFGIAQYRRGESADDLIARADACLYASKTNGRDRVTSDSNDDRAAA